MRLRHPPPLLGEQSNAILNEWLAFSEDQISQLREDGVI
jgi:crotonobetainyl-CoA:carnitine CoA-transferase CaiB-like acyl-CoA transferase